MNCSRPMEALLLSPSILGMRACALNTQHVYGIRSTCTEYRGAGHPADLNKLIGFYLLACQHLPLRRLLRNWFKFQESDAGIG